MIAASARSGWSQTTSCPARVIASTQARANIPTCRSCSGAPVQSLQPPARIRIGRGKAGPSLIARSVGPGSAQNASLAVLQSARTGRHRARKGSDTGSQGGRRSRGRRSRQCGRGRHRRSGGAPRSPRPGRPRACGGCARYGPAAPRRRRCPRRRGIPARSGPPGARGRAGDPDRPPSASRPGMADQVDRHACGMDFDQVIQIAEMVRHPQPVRSDPLRQARATLVEERYAMRVGQ